MRGHPLVDALAHGYAYVERGPALPTGRLGPEASPALSRQADGKLQRSNYLKVVSATSRVSDLERGQDTRRALWARHRRDFAQRTSRPRCAVQFIVDGASDSNPATIAMGYAD